MCCLARGNRKRIVGERGSSPLKRKGATGPPPLRCPLAENRKRNTKMTDVSPRSDLSPPPMDVTTSPQMTPPMHGYSSTKVFSLCGQIFHFDFWSGNTTAPPQFRPGKRVQNFSCKTRDFTVFSLRRAHHPWLRCVCRQTKNRKRIVCSLRKGGAHHLPHQERKGATGRPLLQCPLAVKGKTTRTIELKAAPNKHHGRRGGGRY